MKKSRPLTPKTLIYLRVLVNHLCEDEAFLLVAIMHRDLFGHGHAAKLFRRDCNGAAVVETGSDKRVLKLDRFWSVV